MNLYLGLFLILAAASVAEYRWPERSKVLYGSCWVTDDGMRVPALRTGHGLCVPIRQSMRRSLR